MARKLFCQISPLTYKISTQKCIFLRHIQNLFSGTHFATTKTAQDLPISVYKHNSLIRRRLYNVDMTLQENKAINLTLAAPLVHRILIRPGETFSFWKLVGNTSKKKGYLPGVTISNNQVSSDYGGGICQFTNLIHWMVLHTPLTITEYHHHNRFDLFPDFGRQVPFGTGTSVLYNYLDYRFQNNTDSTFELLCFTTEEYLCGELRADKPLSISYHIRLENERFVQENGATYRLGEIYRDCVDKHTGNLLERQHLASNHALVLYPMEQRKECSLSKDIPR